MRHIRDVLKEGFIIDNSAAGRPWAYKGQRFQPTESFPCHTELETELFDVLKKARRVVGVAGATEVYALIITALSKEGS